MKRVLICLVLILLTALPITSYQYSENIYFNHVKWHKETLQIIILGGDEHHQELVQSAIGNFMYDIVKYTGSYDKWHYQLNIMTAHEWTKWSWYIHYDILIFIQQGILEDQSFGLTLKYNTKGQELGWTEPIDHADIYVAEKYNETSYLPDYVFYSIVEHEFAHSLGLGHTSGEIGLAAHELDLMATGDNWIYGVQWNNMGRIDLGGNVTMDFPTENTTIADITFKRTGFMHPSQLDLDALIHLYDLDGWQYESANETLPNFYGESYGG